MAKKIFACIEDVLTTAVRIKGVILETGEDPVTFGPGQFSVPLAIGDTIADMRKKIQDGLATEFTVDKEQIVVLP